MRSLRDEIIRQGNPFSREYREAIIDIIEELEAVSSQPQYVPPPSPQAFVAKLTGASAILADRVWKYKWEEQPGGRSSTGGSDDYQFFALNGGEVSNPAVQTSGGLVTAAEATFGVDVGDLTDPPSTVTLLPLTEGPAPYVVMHQMPTPVTVTISSTPYECFYWFHAANQVSVACS